MISCTLQVGIALGQLLALGACCMPCALQLQPSGREFASQHLSGPHQPSVDGSALAFAAMMEYTALHAQVLRYWSAATCCMQSYLHAEVSYAVLQWQQGCAAYRTVMQPGTQLYTCSSHMYI